MDNFGTPSAVALQKPGKIQAVAIMTLISGISNILWMISLGFILVTTGIITIAAVVGIFFCLLVPLVIPPLVLGVFEIIYAAKLLPTPIKTVKLSKTIAILEIVCALTLNPIPVAAGILALVAYNDPAVQAYFAANAVPQTVS